MEGEGEGGGGDGEREGEAVYSSDNSVYTQGLTLSVSFSSSSLVTRCNRSLLLFST